MDLQLPKRLKQLKVRLLLFTLATISTSPCSPTYAVLHSRWETPGVMVGYKGVSYTSLGCTEEAARRTLNRSRRPLEAEALYEIGCAKISYSDPISEQIDSITDRRGCLGETIRPCRQEVCSLLLFQS